MNAKPSTGLIAWMARNHIAANLAMFALLLGGVVMGMRLKQEISPQLEVPWVKVWVSYPGATPTESEKGIALALEEAVQNVEDVKTVYSGCYEGGAGLDIELRSGTNGEKSLEKIQRAVDAVSLPEGAKKPDIDLYRARDNILSLMIYGDVSEKALIDFADNVRDELLLRPQITLVEIKGADLRQIAVEVPQETLRRYSLHPQEIANKLRDTSLQPTMGKINTTGGQLLLTSQEERDPVALYSDVAIRSYPGGGTLCLGDIATIKEEGQDSRQETLFNGKPAVRLDIFRVGDTTPIEVSQSVRSYVEELLPRLPDGVSVTVWDDDSVIFKDRVDLLGRNALMGLVLVLLLLGVFLDLRLAFWVTMGIPISIIGCLLFLPMTGATINMVSLFAFIITIGIVVDDAIIVGEIVHQKREQGMPPLEAAIAGTKEIAVPVTCAVLTNIAAFAPLFFIPGIMGQLFWQIPAVVVAVFLVSLFESLFILPCHLSRRGREKGLIHWLNRRRARFDILFHYCVDRLYLPFLRKCLRYHYATLAAGIALLILSVGAIQGGYVPCAFWPTMEAEEVTVSAVLRFGTRMEDAREVAASLNSTGEQVIKELGEENFRGIYGNISPIFSSGYGAKGSYEVKLQLALAPAEARMVNAKQVASLWRERVVQSPSIQTISFDAEIIHSWGSPIQVSLSHRSNEVLAEVSKRVAQSLSTYAGVTDIADGTAEGEPQIALELRPEAKSLGITSQSIAEQVRGSFSGTEALRERHGYHELPVVVRLPKEERETLYSLEQMILQTPTDGHIALSDAAYFHPGHTDKSIHRENGRRSIAVTADVLPGVNADNIVGSLEAKLKPELLQLFPGLEWGLGGRNQEQQEMQGSMLAGFLLALFAIYALLAIPFQSYIQPLIVMFSIPFGIVGAIAGHLLLGYELSVISLLGIVALAGVVVNDSLVLVATANRLRKKEALSAFDALVHASKTRFRPIILTSLTTFFGLMPIIFETSLQARFLIPMAISLGFGILFSTGIILLLCPAAYLLLAREK